MVLSSACCSCSCCSHAFLGPMFVGVPGSSEEMSIPFDLKEGKGGKEGMGGRKEGREGKDRKY